MSQSVLLPVVTTPTAGIDDQASERGIRDAPEPRLLADQSTSDAQAAPPSDPHTAPPHIVPRLRLAYANERDDRKARTPPPTGVAPDAWRDAWCRAKADWEAKAIAALPLDSIY